MSLKLTKQNEAKGLNRNCCGMIKDHVLIFIYNLPLLTIRMQHIVNFQADLTGSI